MSNNMAISYTKTESDEFYDYCEYKISGELTTTDVAAIKSALRSMDADTLAALCKGNVTFRREDITSNRPSR